MIRKRREQEVSNLPKVRLQKEQKLQNRRKDIILFFAFCGIWFTVCSIIFPGKDPSKEFDFLLKPHKMDFDEKLGWQLSRHVTSESSTPATHVITTSGESICECDLISIDCLKSFHCINFYDVSQSISLGVLTRKILKETARLKKKRSQSMGGLPIGKAFQYTTSSTWKLWVDSNEMMLGFRGRKDKFINETLYPYCQKHGLIGKRCFFRDVNESEDLDWLETEALEQYPIQDDYVNSPITKSIKQDLRTFRSLSKYDESSKHLPALGNLLTFAHLARIRFNRQDLVRDFYTKKMESIAWNQSEISSKALRVGIHIRRADACDHADDESYEMEKSQLFSPAQVSGARLCYATSVYMQELRHVKDLAGDNRPIHVYVSTDYAGSVLAEIKSKFSDLYESMNWYFLNYSRDTFQYENSIEDPSNKEKQNVLGETAVADLWHLSHSQVFIGHLGSRFGKLSWLLAMARYNMFVPFSSIDGHSFCCEVDENCGKMKPYITSMENCMTYFHEMSGMQLNEDYWESGSTIRREFAKAKLMEKQT
mmetsp:Transcript_12496/g.19254  ORF Transcript_12496/g.19254 Transcript_12496/m.19254 type:complete len:538 (-) Transcript_12496:2903-4516(-)